MQKILVPTDFSGNAGKAVMYAAEIASKNGAAIYLLHVIEPVTDNIRQPYPLHARLQAEIEKNRLRELRAVQQSIAQQYPGIHTVTEMINDTVTTAVVDFAASIGADLIVMGTRGATGLKEIFMGSTTSGAIGKTKVPVLAVPEAYVMEVPDAILFSTNHFERNTGMLTMIAEMAKLFGATVYVAVFIDTDTAEATDYLNNARHMHHYLDFLNNSFPGVAFKGDVLDGKDFEESITGYEIKNEADIIAMITYPKSFWERLIKRSVTKKMAFHSKIPLLAIPALT